MSMVDITGKEMTSRTATAEGMLELGEAALEAIRAGTVRKGDPLAAAEVAALLAVKNTPWMIPHCHPVPITSTSVSLEPVKGGVRCSCTVRATYSTGVEMEALAGVSAALLTVWDMVKYLEKDADGQYPKTRITDIRVTEKRKELRPLTSQKGRFLTNQEAVE